jgi:hypothetical protein
MRIARPASMLDGFSRTPTVGAPSAAVDHVRTCDQPQDREGARTHRAGQATRYRRRGNRIGALFAALRWVAIGTKRHFVATHQFGRYRTKADMKRARG